LKGYKEINGNLIHETALVDWDNLKIGTGNKIGPYSVIGSDAQHMREPSTGIIEIGNNNAFFEYVNITRPTKISNITKIGNNNFFMSNSMIHHDCVIEDDITLSNFCVLSGHVYLMKGCILGLNVNVHQFQIIGSYAMLGMGTVVTPKNEIIPGNVYIGSPARILRKNKIGLERNNIDEEMLNSEIERFRTLKKRS
jgi:UDP-N-acetylglucosamine acyltransferase